MGAFSSVQSLGPWTLESTNSAVRGVWISLFDQRIHNVMQTELQAFISEGFLCNFNVSSVKWEKGLFFSPDDTK